MVILKAIIRESVSSIFKDTLQKAVENNKYSLRMLLRQNEGHSKKVKTENRTLIKTLIGTIGVRNILRNNKTMHVSSYRYFQDILYNKR